MPSDRALSRGSSALGARGLRVLGKLNVPLYRLSRGRLFGKVGRAPVLLLTTTGRRSGEPRTAPVLYHRDGERIVVIGSNAGNERPPAWALNLEANPECQVEVGARRSDARARIAQGEERERLWQAMSDRFGGFEYYRERTDRDIKVFVLESISAR